MSTLVELKSFCKKTGIKGYSALSKSKLIQKIIKEGYLPLLDKHLLDKQKQKHKQKEKHKQKDKEKDKILKESDHKKIEKQIVANKIFTKTKLLSKEKQQKKEEIDINKYCSERDKYEMRKPLIKARIELYLPYYSYSRPTNLLEDSMKKNSKNQSYLPTIYSFFEEGNQQFLPLPSNKPISVKTFIDPVWLDKQNIYINSLTPFQRALIFVYTNNSFKSITPLLLSALKIKKNQVDTLWENYKKWAENNSRCDPFTITFYYLIYSPSFLSNFKKEDQDKLLELKHKGYDRLDVRFLFQISNSSIFEFVMNTYFKLLYEIYHHAPAVESPFYIFRKDDDINRFKKSQYESKTFVSCSNSQQYIIRRSYNKKSYFIRLKINPGTKLLFVKGLSFFPEENEFLLGPSLFTDMKMISLRFAESIDNICSKKTTEAYDINVKPCSKIPPIYL
jgi:hypothetical protein